MVENCKVPNWREIERVLIQYFENHQCYLTGGDGENYIGVCNGSSDNIDNYNINEISLSALARHLADTLKL